MLHQPVSIESIAHLRSGNGSVVTLVRTTNLHRTGSSNMRGNVKPRPVVGFQAHRTDPLWTGFGVSQSPTIDGAE